MTLERSPELLGHAWVREDPELGSVAPLEPPELGALLSCLRSGRPSRPSR